MRIYALSAVAAGYDLIRALLDRGVPLDGVIALSDRGPRDKVSGFVMAGEVDLPAHLAITEVDDYTLRSDADRAALGALDIDVLIVAGWQRLVPAWLIDHCRLGVVGLHGSARGINAGRGRSPQNWALICGADSFEIAAFLIQRGVDDGPVLAAARFPYTEHDDIVSSYHKSMLLGAEMIAAAVADWPAAVAGATAQDDGEIAYLPKRVAADGAIDWHQPCAVIRRLIAALTRPYPGASSSLNGAALTVWRARPVGALPLAKPVPPGTILQTGGDGGFLVQGGDGVLMVDAYDYAGEAQGVRAGAVLISTPMRQSLGAVLERHRDAFPDQPLSADLEELMAVLR